ncbi:MAG: LysM peptidoglycan-binding domain-containing protein [Phycisphaerae bacterium]|nr:LysM peptidoglycan-binding domain-containing protein [Phycisphaerae bacterium]
MTRTNQKSLGMVLGVVIFAAAAWSFYAWKFSSTNPPDVGSDQAASISNDAPRFGSSEPSSTRTSKPENAPDLDAAIRPNEATSIRESVEATTPTVAIASVPTTADTSNPLMPSAFGNSAARALKTGRDALASGEVIKARAALSRALALGVNPPDQQFIRRELDRLSDALLFSRATTPDDPLTAVHVVKTGESLFVIARKYQISEELIMTLNGIRDRDSILAGSRLKVIKGPFSARIYKSAHRIDLSLGDVFVRSFPVGLGTDGGTPTGEWLIKSKLTNPDWADPISGRYFAANDPENPIGERWISLECISGECMGRIGFGIHGTIDPKSIGADMSMGCVRLGPDEVAFVFDLLVPKYSRVMILQ